MENGKSAAILVVEDDMVVARDLQQTLLELGYDAFAVAGSAREALLRAAERPPDLALVDIRIKGDEDGIDTAEKLRREYRIPVVYLTAYADPATVERAKHTEPYGYLVKPVDTAELRSTVELSIYKHSMERKLAERERWLETTLRSIAEGVVCVDSRGSVTFMNAAAEAMTGVAADEATGHDADDFLQFADARARPVSSPLAEALRTRAPVELSEELLLMSRGGEVMIGDSAAPVSADGELLGAVMVFRDVGEQRRLRRQLEISGRLASLGTMAAHMAHEINNPLAIVTANASFITQKLGVLREELERPPANLDPACRRHLEAIAEALAETETAAFRVGRVVSDLRTFARPPQGDRRRADVIQAVEWAVRAIGPELGQRARLTTEFGRVPLVAAEEGRLRQVFLNLLLNALEAIQPGAVDANQIRVVARLQQGRVVVEVRDSGCGIPPDAMAQIFEPFFTTKEVGVGTGLGLSVCYGIVKSLGGEVQAESQAGKGSVFRVLLPPAADDEPIEPHQSAAGPRRPAVLVVDDDPVMLKVVGTVLDPDYDVTSARTAWRALELAQESGPYDLILCDVTMPGITGLDFFGELRVASPDLAGRVAFMTGGTASAEIQAFLGSVENRVLMKPFDVAELRAFIDDLLKSH
jgi:two-component system, cell cycle sensor histidine kinase and response regulator CckA